MTLRTKYWLPLAWVACLSLTGCIRTPNADLIREYMQCVNAGMGSWQLYNEQGISGYQCIPPQTTKAQTLPK